MMRSSKVFKDDPSFIPTTLIRKKIEPTADQRIEQPAIDSESAIQPETSPLKPPPKKNIRQDAPTEQPQEQSPPIDIEALRHEAYEQGRADAKALAGQTLEAFEKACGELDNLRKNLLEQSRADTINLIMTLTSKIIGQELETRRDAIAHTLLSALEQAIESDEYFITLHPDDLTVARELEPELITSVRGLERIVLKTDPDIRRGGCVLESSICAVDATIETQLDTVREFLEDQLPEFEEPENTPATEPDEQSFNSST
ncbi:MAG: hypothetical protein GQ559_01595 [Desulfobulbaceae bacterium]|nr:hypothetical protein [Desulfobulbaceae bacterium]